MSSTDPPSRIPPRNQSPDTKSVRDELTSKGRVEKVREVDADEARKRKFQRYYNEDALADERAEEDRKPSPFELVSRSNIQPAALPDVEDAIVADPTYTPPPNVVNLNQNLESEAQNQATSGSLPQAHKFWDDVDFPPDKPNAPRDFDEKTSSKGAEAAQLGAKKKEGGKTEEDEKKKQAGAQELGDLSPSKKGAKKAPSPFEPTLMNSMKEDPSSVGMKGAKKDAASKEEKKKQPSPFELAASTPPTTHKPSDKKRPAGFVEEPMQSAVRPTEREEEPGTKVGKGGKKSDKEKEEEAVYYPQDPGVIPFKAEEREGDGGQKGGHNKKVVEITATSLPTFPSAIQPQVIAATMQATPYLSPSTIPLFFQMVGTMYVMATPGINRTEIVLNNPMYANSRFFGSTITIEKYATAPDSFNIRLSGTDQAVVTFKENIPSLMAAFEQGNFAFKVNRIDVEYKVEKPLFHRKEKKERGDAGGGDLGERRK